VAASSGEKIIRPDFFLSRILVTFTQLKNQTTMLIQQVRRVIQTERPFVHLSLDEIRSLICHAEMVAELTADDSPAAELLLASSAQILRDACSELAQRN
jgi:hypothetical protein